VDIRSETEFAAEEAEHGYEEEEVQGRCAAVLSNGRRCPNAALPGSRYCGLEVHQALAGIDSDRVVDLVPAGAPASAQAPATAGANGESPAVPEPSETAALAAEQPDTLDVTPAGEPASTQQREQVGETAEGQSP